MRLTVLGVALLASASAIGEGYITSVRLPDGTTKTFQDAGARQEIQDILSQKYLKPESVKAGDNVSVTTNESGEVTISADISSTSPAFSNAVLSVGLGIDTNTVAAINELVDSTHGLPVTGAVSVGALLLALAAAIAALKRGKSDRSDATLTPIYSDTPTFSEWTFSDVSDGITDIQQPTFIPYPSGESRWEIAFSYDGQVRPAETFVIDKDATNLTFEYGDEGLNLHITATRTRTDIIGYRLGPDSATNPNRDKPLASEAEAEALRQGKADKPATFTTGNLAALDADGNPTDSGISKDNLAGEVTILGKGASSSITTNSAIAIGGSSKESGLSGAQANGSQSIAIGTESRTQSLRAIAIGYGSSVKANANNAVQIGTGTNDVANSLRFRDTTVVDGNGKIPSANLDVEVAEKSDLRYAMTAPTVSGTSVTLDDRAYNYIDARSLGSSDTIDLDFPAIVDGKSRDFVLAVECGANPPAISYAAFVTIMAEDASSLTPEEGMNIYAFTEFKPNMFLASRKLITTVVDNSPENGDQLLLAMQKRGIDTTNITDFGGVATALGLSDTATLQDAIDAVMN